MRNYSRTAMYTPKQAAAEAVHQSGVDMHERERSAVVRHSPHLDRDAEATRDDSVRVDHNPTKWVNPTSLDAPPPRPGWVQRWIADGVTGGANNPNERHWLSKRREGWQPRDPASVSEAQRHLFPSSKLASGQDIIRLAGLVLCEMPRQVAQQRHKAVQDLTMRQSKAIPDSLEELRRRDSNRGSSFGEVEVTDENNTVRGRVAPTMVD